MESKAKFKLSSNLIELKKGKYNNELNLYYQKQFMRDKQLLLNENKSLFEKVNEFIEAGGHVIVDSLLPIDILNYEKDDDYIPDGLVFSDDDDFLVDVDLEPEDERLRSSFPKEKPRRNLIPGGPQAPDLTMFPESERDAVWAKYKKARKKYADDERQKCLKNQMAFVGVSGDQSTQLRPMSEVEKYGLSEGQIFQSKDILQLGLGRRPISMVFVSESFEVIIRP